MVLGNCSVGGVACSALADADAVELSWSIAGEKLSNAKLNSGFVMLPASVRLLSLMYRFRSCYLKGPGNDDLAPRCKTNKCRVECSSLGNALFAIQLDVRAQLQPTGKLYG